MRKSDSGALVEAEVREITSQNSIIGWTMANVIKTHTAESFTA
jgi:hypothetical protein